MTPPDFTGYYDKNIDEWIHSQKELRDELAKGAIAPSVEKAQEDLDEATADLQSKQELLEQEEGKPYASKAFVLKLKSQAAELEMIALLMKIRLLNTQIAKQTETPERSTGKLESRIPTQSSIFPGLKGVGRRLKTRRRKARNGSARIRKHRTTRVSRR